MNKELPVLALRGDGDVCTGYGKGSHKSINILKSAGFNNIKQIVYKDMRHEILNEAEKEKVYRDVVEFLG